MQKNSYIFDPENQQFMSETIRGINDLYMRISITKISENLEITNS